MFTVFNRYNTLIVNYQLLNRCAPNGNSYYVADSQKTIDFLIDYALDEKIVESIVNLTPIAGTEEAQAIINAIGQSKEGLATIEHTLAGMLLKKLDEIL